MNKPRALLIHNPTAGVQNQAKIKELLLKSFHPIYDLTYVQTQSAQHFNEVVNGADFEESNIVLACGGDGTINTIAAKVFNTHKVLGILPTGSGNGLAKSIGFNSLQASIEAVLAQKEIKIDVLQINGNPSFNVSGIGFDAHVAKLFEKEIRRGFWTYLRIVLKEMRHKSLHMKIDCDGLKMEGDYWLLSIANSNQWGNNIYINPAGSLQDGVFELVAIERLYWYEIPKLLFLLLQKQIHQHPKVHVLSGKRANIEVSNAPLHLDGDYFGNIKERVQVDIEPAKLRIFA